MKKNIVILGKIEKSNIYSPLLRKSSIKTPFGFRMKIYGNPRLFDVYLKKLLNDSITGIPTNSLIVEDTTNNIDE